MSYSSQIADLLAAQLTKFVTLNRHQLAGQASNLDFWLLEVRHCLAVIDGYRERFEQGAQGFQLGQNFDVARVGFGQALWQARQYRV